MKLFVETTGDVQDPSPADIARVLGGLDGIAILSRDELTYLQTDGTPAEGFVLEYQAGSTEEHYACPCRLPLDEVIQAFLAYARGDPSWRTSLGWEKVRIISWTHRLALCLGALALASILVVVLWAILWD
jgi:hypothetical protein